MNNRSSYSNKKTSRSENGFIFIKMPSVSICIINKYYNKKLPDWAIFLFCDKSVKNFLINLYRIIPFQ